MKSKQEIIRWVDMMLSFHPNAEDSNFFNDIKEHLKNDTLLEVESIRKELKKKVRKDYIPHTGGYETEEISVKDVFGIIDEHINALMNGDTIGLREDNFVEYLLKYKSADAIVMLLQGYTQRFGPLSDENGEKIKKYLKEIQE